MSNLPKRDPITHAQGSPIYYEGPDLTLGPMPAIIYLALSATASLYEDPFNQPVTTLVQEQIRIFSWDLPFHPEGSDYQKAMQKWAIEIINNPNSLFHFIEMSKRNIDFLIENKWIDPSYIGVMGLSRGAFAVTHLAAKDERLKHVLGFAPLTQLRPVDEFSDFDASHLKELALSSITDQLIHKTIRFYIGNHDIRVGTESCFHFIKNLVDTAFIRGIRSPPIEMIIYPSIGHKGHGTPPPIFQDGANWIKTKLVK